MPRIAIGGIQHESSTFWSTPTTLDHFLRADAWPALSRGDALFDAVSGINLPIAGFIDEGRRAGFDLVPLLWCSAVPAGLVTRDAFETIAGWMINDLKRAGPLDGLLLDVRGAMVTNHLDDADGELLRRIRAAVGPTTPIIVSLDFNANVSPTMIEAATGLIAYRSYPHVDMAETGVRCAKALHDLLAAPGPIYTALHKIPFLVPLPFQSTSIEPAQSLIALLGEIERRENVHLSLTLGLPLADVPDSAPAVFGFGRDRAAIERAVTTLTDAVVAAEDEFAGTMHDVDSAARQAVALARTATRPVILADVQDNPSAGGTADGVAIAKALLRHGATGAVVGLVWDSEAAAAAHAAGIGATIELALGARSGVSGESPLQGRFYVTGLGTGTFTADGPFYKGCRMQLGPMAHLTLDGVGIVVTTAKQQAADRSMFRHVGIEPERQKILSLKSTAHFRGDFAAIAAEILIVAGPGRGDADIRELPYRRLASGTRIGPRGRTFRP
ncbi:MAG: M81 family peptidase [Rhodospirillales bacterium]|nr:M81 family peptidase [Rhodospirillales bacterium]